MGDEPPAGPTRLRSAGIAWGACQIIGMSCRTGAPHATPARRPLRGRRAGPAGGSLPLLFIHHYLKK